jgi:uncharacterized membrane protein
LSVAAFTLIAAIIGFIRELVLPVEMRLYISMVPHWEGWQGMPRAKKVVWVAALLAVFGIAGSLIYFEVALPEKPAPTEFYILNAEGQAENYPTQIKAGDNETMKARRQPTRSEQSQMKMWLAIRRLGRLLMEQSGKEKWILSWQKRVLPKKLIFIYIKAARENLISRNLYISMLTR